MKGSEKSRMILHLKEPLSHSNATLKKTIQNEITLTRVMFQYARENSQNTNVGRKRKHGSRISVQSTAIARRTHRAVGRSVASYGRKEHVQENKRRQLILDDNDGDDVYYSLPTSIHKILDLDLELDA